MSDWTDETLRALNRQYAEAGLKPFQRPLRAAVDILKGSFSMGAGGNPEVEAITARFRALFPAGDDTWPGLGAGIIASTDDVRKVIAGIPFGSPALPPPWRYLGFDSETLWREWCQDDSGIITGTVHAMADIHDFAIGADTLRHGNAQAASLWHMAGENLANLADILPKTGGVDSVLQPICLTAELSLKAAIAHAGTTPPHHHKLVSLANQLAGLAPHADDNLIAQAVALFPPYVESRYEGAGLVRLHVVRLALASQFIAASSTRRFLGNDLAKWMADNAWAPARGPLLP
ncbi:HEPN domain-containing protein [Luteibacter sp. 621]|uniref:HEPN domain-containing protein n=1 Tax=Luteibacter sp. 621 TaxID=3373916 RepID=UPI003D24A97B